MKTKLSPLCRLSCVLCLLALSPMPHALSQIPQGFNYQAVARNASGGLITNVNLPVRMSIQSDSLGGTVFWQELHSSVITTDQGMINLVIGKGTRQSASTVATFSAIDWSVTPRFLKIEIDYSGWKTLGVSRLWSVPYAMVAGDLDGPIDKLAIEGETSGLEEALFEVKNKDGQTVFAVYNEGVRIYVSDGAKAVKGGFAVGGFGTDKTETTKYFFVGKDSVRVYLDTNPLTKKLKGGFAVGGYDLNKGTVQDYLDVNADSVRIYIDSDPTTKKIKGGFAVGGYDMTKGTNTNYMNVNTDASGIINPSQNRILWYPLKNAFLTGRVRIGTPDSVGVNSFATGYESKSRGMYSQALGFKAIANGDFSTAIGKNAVADKINSFAFGDSARAINAESYAFGRGALASGYRSFAFGSAGVDEDGHATDAAHASGDYSFAIGQGSRSIGTGSICIGLADTAQGVYATAIGYKTSARSQFSTALGMGTTAKGAVSTAMGWYSIAAGSHSIAMGSQASAVGNYSFAVGAYSKANGNYAVAIGYLAVSSGVDYGSTAIGYQPTASGRSSTAIGFWAKATGDYSTALGRETTASGMWSSAIGYQATASGISTAIGYVASADNGSISIGHFTTASGYSSTAVGNSIRASGDYATGFGAYTRAKGYGSTSMGYGSSAVGKYSTAIGYYTKSRPYASLSIGQYNDTTCSVSPDGSISWQSADPLFVCGNGTSTSSLSNAFTVYKNGFTETAGILRVKGYNTFPTSGIGIEIYYMMGNGFIQCYDRATSTYKPLNITAALIKPTLDNVYSLGTSSSRWSVVYAANGTIQTSDRRVKEDILQLSGGLETILNLNPVTFKWKNQSDPDRHTGLIAQEVLPIIPEIVDIGSDPDKLMGINYGGLVPIMVSAIKEQQQIIEKQQLEIEHLKSLEDEVSELKALVNSLIANQAGTGN